MLILSSQVRAQAQVFCSNKAINSITDFEGLRMRSTGTESAELIEALGATPVSITFTDVYMSARQGLLDGTFSGWNGHVTSKIWEVFDYALDFPFNAGGCVLIMTKDVYDTLPGDLKVVLMEEAQRLEDTEYIESVKASVRDRQVCRDNGLTFTTADAELIAGLRSLAAPISENWGKKSPATGEALAAVKVALGTR
ncbi:TRAP transporter substrate-binding protein [Chloroflexota bacterium]